MHRVVIAFTLLAAGNALAKARAPVAEEAPASEEKASKPADKPSERPGEKPGEREFLGCNKYPAEKRFRWGVRGEVGVAELVASLGELSCQAIVIGPNVSSRAGKVTLEVPDLLTAPEVYRLFYSALETLGFTVEKSGKALKIVDTNRAKEVSRPLASGEATPEDERFVTRLMSFRYARAQDVSEILGKLKSKDGDVALYAPTGSLIITDRALNVRRMEAIAAELDVPRPPSAEHLFLVTTHQQAATELSATMEKILVAQRRSEAPAADAKGAPSRDGQPLADGIVALIPVDAARALVVVGNENGWRRITALAARLDPAASDEVGGQAHVIYLEHTNAEDMAGTLSAVGLQSRVGGAPSSSTPGSPGMPGSQSAPRPSNGMSPTGGASSAIPLTGEVRIAADKVSNAIVVFANAADFQMVRDLVGKLDVPRRQVYVEATILDVTVDNERTVGLKWYGGNQVSSDGTTVVGGVGSALGVNSSGGVQLDAKALLGTLAGGVGVLGPNMTIAGQTLPSFGVLLQAIESSKDVNVLSKPHLLTTDNVKASLSVGQSIPFASGAIAATTGSVTTSYQRQDVALKLDLTPHLNDSDSVRLELAGEISDVPDGQNLATAGGPITNKRTITTAVVVRDGESIVLGGLQKESDSISVDKVPFLGDIPLLGRLFQTRSKSRVKQDLLIVLTPYVVRGPEDLRRIFERRNEERREFMERFTAFRDANWEPRVDYRTKRGLLVEIDAAAFEAERESVAVQKAKKMLRPRATEGPIEEN